MVTTAATLLVLLALANGTPVLAQRLFRERWARPVDGGRRGPDGQPLLGPSKTWRGLLAGTLGSGLGAALLGPGLAFGLVFGALALLGDLFSSFCKRRLGLASSARATGLDQLPESLLPMIFASWWLSLGLLLPVLVVAVFVVGNMLMSPLLYRLGIRRQPH